MNYIIKLFILISIVLNVSLFASDQLKKVSLQLNWKYQFEYAGFIIAKEKGFYKNIGFDVELKEFTNTTKTLEDLVNSQSTFTISDRMFMIERQKNDVVLLANYLKQSPLVILSHKSIKHPRDLESKIFMSSMERIKNTPIYFMFSHLGVNINKIQFKENTYNIEDFIENNTDAMPVYKSNELYKLEKDNIPYTLIDPKDYGFNSGSVNMFTTQQNIDKYGKRNIELFIDATNKGWRYAFENTEETINLIFRKYNDSLNKPKEALQFEANEIKKLFLLSQFELGTINKQEIYRWYDILNNYGLLEKQNRYDSFLFNNQWRERVYTQYEITIFIIVVCLIIMIMLVIVYFLKSKEKLLTLKNKEILDEQKIFKTLFYDSSDGILILKDEKILDCNKAIVQIFGFTNKEEILQSSILELSAEQQENNESSPAKIREKIQVTLQTGTNSFEWIYKKRNQKEFWAHVTLTRMQLNKQDVIHGVVRDISENKKLEKDLENQKHQLFEQSKMAALGEMIGNIAHQWRQPLSVISTGSTGIKVQKELGILDDNVFYETCDTINDNAQYLSKTIDDFTNFIKGDREKEIFILENTIESFIHLVSSSIKNNNINIELNLQKDIRINGYENELIQCLMNIFNNSKDAFKEKNIQNKYIFISSSIQNNNMIIEIKDNALGIQSEILPKIFEPYFTTKHKYHGTGIGLNMTYNLIVDGMKGTIKATNVEYGFAGQNFKGVAFIISLPVK